MVQAHFASFALQSPWDIHSENRFEWTWKFKIGLIANLSAAPKSNKKNKIKWQLRKANCLAHSMPLSVFSVLSAFNIYAQWEKPGQIRGHKRALLKTKLYHKSQLGLTFVSLKI